MRGMPWLAWQRFLPHLVCLTILAAGVGVRLAHDRVNVRTPDERVYFFYARSLYRQGPSELQNLVRRYAARPEFRNLPSPSRVGFVWLQWATMVATSDPSLRIAVGISFVSSVLILVLVWWLGAAFLTPWAAAVAMLFLAFSPLDLALSRRVWSDEPVALAVTAMQLCFLEHVRSRRAAWVAAFFACAIAAILIKETALFFLALGTSGLVLFAWREAAPRRAWALAAAGTGAVVVALAIQAAACGGWESVRSTLIGVAQAQVGNEYMQKYQTGGWQYYVRGFAILQPTPIALGFLAAVWAVVTAIVPSARRMGLGGLGVAWRWPSALWILGTGVLAFAAIALVYPMKNMRFLSPIYPALFLLAGAAVVAAIGWLSDRATPAARPALIGAGVLALAALAYADHSRFVHFFIERGVPDLATPWFVK